MADITARMFYCFRAFDTLPHGSDEKENRNKMIRALLTDGNLAEGATVQQIRAWSSEVYSRNNPYIRLAYPGSEVIDLFEALEISWQAWLDFVLENGVTNLKRNDLKKGAVAKRGDIRMDA